ncbi:MAG TPA: hypothetical protein P5287_01650 [bacterium]|nr:hypothetical protein [bacterium]
MGTENMELGTQPLDGIMTRLNLANADLVKASIEQLTHKVVQKGRKGRRLTQNAREKILKALNAVSGEEKFALKDLFTY